MPQPVGKSKCELGSHHLPDNLPHFGPIESGTHCHLDPISDHRHPNRLAHLEPELRGPDSLADSAAHHRRPHGLADGRGVPLPGLMFTRRMGACVAPNGKDVDE